MSGASVHPRETPPVGFWRSVGDVVVALLVMNSAVFQWRGDQIGKECHCTDGSAALILDVARVILIAAAGWLALLAWHAWRRRQCRSCHECTHAVWVFLRDERHHVLAAIVPWIMAIVGVVALTVPPQTADMLSGLENERGSPLWCFALGALVWGLSTWFCGRWAIDIERRASGRAESWLALWNPRIMALLTGFAIVVVAVQATGLCSFAFGVSSAVAGVVFLFAVLRRPVALWLMPTWRVGGRPRRHVRQPPANPTCWAAFIHAIRTRPVTFLDDLRAAPGGPLAVWLALAAGLAVIVCYAVAPQTAGDTLNAPGTVLLGIGCLTMLATFLSKAGWRIARVPVLLLCFAVTAVLGQNHHAVNHAIRKLGPLSATPAPTLDQAASSWLTACGKSLVHDGVLKVVLVSTAGGASRAALWTLDALNELETRDPAFPRRVFAISAVSGGALGATVWTAQLANAGFDCTADPANAPPDSTLATMRARHDQGRKILGHDFLAPVLAAWLARDIPLGVLPVNWMLPPIEDRSAALEEAWEAAWREETGDDLLAGDFMSLWHGKFNRPLLLLNGTIEETGQPIVTAPISFVDANGIPNGDFPATYDARALLGAEPRTSTAILNAARFPVVTSQGDVHITQCPGGKSPVGGACDDKVAPDSIWLSVVDGGYFDNIGAGTTIRAAAALRGAFDALKTSGTFAAGVTLRIMVVGINSDPDRLVSQDAWKLQDPPGKFHQDIDQLMRCDPRGSTLLVADAGRDNTLNAEIAPFLAIVATQSGHTTMRLAELNQQFCAVPRDPKAASNYVMLSLCPVINDQASVSLPLNWVMAPATLTLFADQDKNFHLRDWCDNAGQFDQYATWLGAAP